MPLARNYRENEPARNEACLPTAAMQQMQLSARAYHRILKLARTIDDLASEADIQTPHVAEAIQYRPRRQV